MTEAHLIFFSLGAFFFRSYLSHLLYNSNRQIKRDFLSFKAFDFEHLMYEFQCIFTIVWFNWKKGNKALIILHNLMTVASIVFFIWADRLSI